MRSADPTTLWDTIRLGLSKQLPEASFKEWIAPCSPVKVEDGTLWIQVPSAAAKLWIEQQLPEEFNDALAQGGLADLHLVFQVTGAPAAEPKPAARKSESGSHPALEAPTNSFPFLFNRYTLDRFVVGPGSQLAFAAAKAVVDSYGKAATPLSMNPLFIYGGAGLGKTHLMVGIGKGLLARNPRLRVAYLKVDNFFNELTVAIKAKNTEPMRKKYQQNDVLLLDEPFTGLDPHASDRLEEMLHLLRDGKRSQNGFSGGHRAFITFPVFSCQPTRPTSGHFRGHRPENDPTFVRWCRRRGWGWGPRRGGTGWRSTRGWCGSRAAPRPASGPPGTPGAGRKPGTRSPASRRRP